MGIETNAIYAASLFIGISIVIIAFIWIITERRKSGNLFKALDVKKEEIERLISDAEHMIEELTHFSEFVSTQMDLKNEELRKNLNLIEGKIKQISTVLPKNADSQKPMLEVSHQREDTKLNEIVSTYEARLSGEQTESQGRSEYKNNNIIIFNSRYREIMHLSDKGCNDSEIACRLRIGKDEVRLLKVLSKIAQC